MSECEKRRRARLLVDFFPESTGMHASNGMVPTTMGMFSEIDQRFSNKKGAEGLIPCHFASDLKNIIALLQSDLNNAYSGRPCLSQQ